MQCITYSHSTRDLFRHTEILFKYSCCILAAYSNAGQNVLSKKIMIFGYPGSFQGLCYCGGGTMHGNFLLYFLLMSPVSNCFTMQSERLEQLNDYRCVK